MAAMLIFFFLNPELIGQLRISQSEFQLQKTFLLFSHWELETQTEEPQLATLTYVTL